MAMFNCPHCKGIVDETTKICPKCNNDIKKFIKDMVKQNKKNAKSGGVSSIALGSIYNSSSSSDTKLPELDFLKPAQEVKLESPSLQKEEQVAQEEPKLDFVQNTLSTPATEKKVEAVPESPVEKQSVNEPAPSFGTISMNDIIENKPQAGAPLPATPVKTEVSEDAPSGMPLKSNSLPPVSGGNANTLPPISGGSTNALPPFPGASGESAKTNTNTLPPISGGSTNALPPFPGASGESAKTNTNTLPPISGGSTNALPPFPGASGESAKTNTNTLPPISGGSTNALPPISGGSTNALPPISGGSTNALPPISGGSTNALPPISGGSTNALPPISGGSTTSSGTKINARPALGGNTSSIDTPKLTSLSMSGDLAPLETKRSEVAEQNNTLTENKVESSVNTAVEEKPATTVVSSAKSIFEVDPQPISTSSQVAQVNQMENPETQIFGNRPVSPAQQSAPANPETQIFGARPVAPQGAPAGQVENPETLIFGNRPATPAQQTVPANPETQIFGARPVAPQGAPAGQAVNPETLMFGNRPTTQQVMPSNPHVGYAMNTSMLSKPAENNEPQKVRKYAMTQNSEIDEEASKIFESPSLRRKITEGARPATEAASILKKAKEQELKDKAFYANFHVGANGYSAMSYQTQVHEGNVQKNPNSLFDSPTLQKIPEGARPASEAVSILKKNNSAAQGSIFESDSLKNPEQQNNFAGTAQNYGGAFAQSKSNIPPYKRPQAGAPMQQPMFGAPQSGAGAANPLLNGGQSGTQSMYGAPAGNSLYGAPQSGVGAPQFMQAGASQNANTTPAGAANPFLAGNNNNQ